MNAVPASAHCYRDPLPPANDRALVAAVDHLTAWFAQLGYASYLDTRDLLSDPQNIAEVSSVQDRPDAEQATWYRERVATIESCGGRDA